MRINVSVNIPEGITCIGCPYYDVYTLPSGLIGRACRLLNKTDAGYIKPTVKFEDCKRLNEGDTLIIEDNMHRLSLRYDGKVL